eukprot:1643748-Amphidinium_carterae.1
MLHDLLVKGPLESPEALFRWKGNAEADRRAKEGSALHPGGLQQIQRGVQLAEHVKAVYKLRAAEQTAPELGNLVENAECGTLLSARFWGT